VERTIRWWLSRERLRARDDPKRWTTAFPERFWTHSLLVNAWDYTDPVSEAQSDLLQISMRTKSPQMVMTERGRDIKQIERDFEEYGDPDVLSTMTRDPTPEVPPPTANPPQPTKDANANP
jgi:hypothetical protein